METDEKQKETTKENSQSGQSNQENCEYIMERQRLLQEARLDIDVEDSIDENSKEGSSRESEVVRRDEGNSTVDRDENLIEDAQSVEQMENNILAGQWPLLEEEALSEIESQDDDTAYETDNERLERYLARYVPEIERYREQMERFESELQRIGPHLERCGSSLERLGPQLEAIGRQLDRNVAQRNESLNLVRPWHPQNDLSNLQTQTESGNEGFGPQSADSCQSANTTSSERPSWMNTQNPRRLSRRPSFQMNDGLLRHWVRRRNVEGRDIPAFNRFRDDRERRRISLWRNDGDIREYRRSRGVTSRSYHDNFNIFSGHGLPQLHGEHDHNDENVHHRSLRQTRNDRENSSLQNQDRFRFRRNSTVHQDDPDFGFVLLNNQNVPGPSRPDTSAPPERRPRSHMSLRPLNMFFPPPLGPITEYAMESDEDNNNENNNNEHRNDNARRRNVRRRFGTGIGSWASMHTYFQPHPIFIGQGDSKAMDGPFTLQRIPLEENILDGNDRHRLEHSRIPRLHPRFLRGERGNIRQQITYQALAL